MYLLHIEQKKCRALTLETRYVYFSVLTHNKYNIYRNIGYILKKI